MKRLQGVRVWLRLRRAQLVLASTVSTLSIVLVGEVGLRLLGSVDEDGNVYALGRHLQPYVLPVRRVEAAIDLYLTSTSSVLMADPEIGWSPRPLSQNALYAYNSTGIRVPHTGVRYEPDQPARTTRVSIFGDSFTNGVDEQFDATWGHLLETELDRSGGEHEVLNFGVPAYGMDQALLRWQTLGQTYSGDVVVFGLQIENLRRNTNLIRPLYNPYVDIPFSKPRFILRGGDLEIINRPTVAPEILPDTIAHISDWQWRPFEDYYDPRDYVARWWHRSRLLRFTSHLLTERGAEDSDHIATDEQRALALRLLHSFRESVEASGAQFVIVHLPRRGDLQAFAAKGRLPASSLLGEIERQFFYAETAGEMLVAAEQHTLGALFNGSEHYTVAANRVVAERLAAALRSLKKGSPKAD